MPMRWRCPPRELVRVAVERVRVDAHGLEQLAHLGLALRAVAHLVHEQRLADDVAHGHAPVEARVGVLEDHLHAAPLLAQGAAGEMREVGARVEHAPGRRADELQDGAARRALAAAALADQPERLALLDLEVDAVDRVDGAHLALEDDAAGDREVDAQVLDRDQGLVGRASCGHLGAGDQRVAVEAGAGAPGVGREELRRRLPSTPRPPASSAARSCSRAAGGRGPAAGPRWSAASPCAARRGGGRCAAGPPCTGDAGGGRAPWPARPRRCVPRTSRGCAGTCRRPRRGRG